MKINSTRGEIQGAALMTTLVICAVLAIMMAGYLMFARQQNFLTYRSQTWNTAMPVAEAGIEEGMQHLNDNYANLATQGWTNSGTTYFRSNTLPNGDSYNVTLYLSNANSPQIVSQARVYTPKYALGSSPMFATIGVTANVNSPIARAVGVTCARSSLFINAMTAKHVIDLNGNNIATDSFDSTKAAYSTSGQYDVAKRRDNGGVASNDTIQNAVNVGNANIYGKVATGPDGTVNVGSNGRVGPLGWSPSGGTNIFPGWFSDDMNFTFPEPGLPAGSIFTPAGGYITNVQVNVSSTTASSYPAPPPATGVTTNFSLGSSTNYPSPAPVAGSVTNTPIITATSGSTYPAAGTYQGSVTTNTTTTSGATYPIAGTYLGAVTTNTLFINTNKIAPPVAGTYLGSVTIRVVSNGPPSGRGTYYDYYLITGYSYGVVSGYTFYKYTGTNYTYLNASFTYAIPVTNVVNVEYYDYILDSGNYQLSALSNGKVLVRGTAHLDVTGSVNLANAEVHYASGGQLNLYVHSNFSLSGNNVFNTPGYAKNFIVWADSGCTSISFSGNAAFTGVLYAPYVDLALNGGGHDDVDFIGAAVINSAKLNGHFSFHYDEDLGNLGGGRFIITAWHEL